MHPMTAAELLRRARAEAGYTQRRLAESSGVPQPAIARIESGRAQPRTDTLERLLNACGGRSLTLGVESWRLADDEWAIVAGNLRMTPQQRVEQNTRMVRFAAAARRAASTGRG